MSENALTVLQQLEGNSDTTALAAMAQGGGFLPRLQLFGGSSDACKEGKIPVAHWGLTREKDNIEDLGKEVEVVVLAGRTKAIQFGDTTLVYYTPTHPEFIRIQGEADAKQQSRMYGAEYLVYIPSAETFATLFLCSPTARRAIPSVNARINKAAVLKSQLIDNGKHKWHGPVCKPLEQPTFELPDFADIKKQLDGFKNARDSEVETVQDTGSERER